MKDNNNTPLYRVVIWINWGNPCVSLSVWYIVTGNYVWTIVMIPSFHFYCFLFLFLWTISDMQIGIEMNIANTYEPTNPFKKENSKGKATWGPFFVYISSIFKRLCFFRTVLDHKKIERKVQRFPTQALLTHMHTFSHYQHPRHPQEQYICYQGEPTLMYYNYQRPLLTLEFTLAVVCSVGFNKCTMTYYLSL